MKRALLAMLTAMLLSPMSVLAQSVVGTYKLVSFAVTIGGETNADFLGKMPNGYIIIMPTRMMTVITKEGRKQAKSMEEKAALVDSIIAYTGPYRIDGGKFITSVDASWSEAWTGTQQARTLSVAGNRLTLVTDPAPFTPDPTKTVTATLVREKIE